MSKEVRQERPVPRDADQLWGFGPHFISSNSHDPGKSISLTEPWFPPLLNGHKIYSLGPQRADVSSCVGKPPKSSIFSFFPSFCPFLIHSAVFRLPTSSLSAAREGPGSRGTQAGPGKCRPPVSRSEDSHSIIHLWTSM